uniref:Uncharacterized protein n=1 Tax=Spongospora subterranea TaxID=70186 RepID=A0A0H5QT91_9EUKA|eukprot:CRZ04942.1 hypothetical protein [Spongospora subterranea]
MYAAVRSLDIQTLGRASEADITPYLPVLILYAESLPHCRALLDKFAKPANAVLRFHQEISNIHQIPELTTSCLDEIPAFSRCPLKARIQIVIQLIRSCSPSVILSSSVVRDEVGSIIAIILLQSIEVLPLPLLLKSLIVQDDGAGLVERIAMNCHDLTSTIVDHCIDYLDDALSSSAESTLRRLAGLSLANAHAVRRALVSRKSSASIIFQITAEILRDDASFLSSIFARTNYSDLHLINSLRSLPGSSDTKSAQNQGKATSTTVNPLCRLISARISQALGSLIGLVDQEVYSEAMLLFHTLCQMHSTLQFLFSREAVNAALDTLQNLAFHSQPLSDHCLCFLFLCSNLFKVASAERVRSSFSGAYRSLLFLRITMACTQGDRSIGGLLSEAVGFSIRPLTGHLEKLAEIIVAEMSSSVVELVLTTSAMNLELFSYALRSNQLKSELQGPSRAHVKTCLTNCIQQIITNPRLPLNPLFPAVLRNIAELCISSSTVSDAYSRLSWVHLLPEAVIFGSLKSISLGVETRQTVVSKSRVATAVLVTYYALYFNRSANSKATAAYQAFRYPSTIIESLPAIGLIRYMEKSSPDFDSILPSFLDLVFDVFPELPQIDDELYDSVYSHLRLCSLPLLTQSCSSASQQNPHWCVDVLSATSIPPTIAETSQFVAVLYHFLNSDEDIRMGLDEDVREVWHYCRCLSGSISFFHLSLVAFTGRVFLLSEIDDNPGLALQCSPRTWTVSESLLKVFLQSVRVFLQRFRAHVKASGDFSVNPLIYDLKVALNVIRFSIGSGSDAIGFLGCRYVDSECRKHPGLLSSILSQGFDIDILPKFVKYTPIVKESTSLVLPLLSLEYENEQIFSLHLLAELTLVRADGTLELCSMVLNRFAGETSDTIVPHLGVLRSCLISLVSFVKVYPKLIPDLVRLLTIVRPERGVPSLESDLAREVDDAFTLIAQTMP